MVSRHVSTAVPNRYLDQRSKWKWLSFNQQPKNIIVKYVMPWFVSTQRHSMRTSSQQILDQDADGNCDCNSGARQDQNSSKVEEGNRQIVGNGVVHGEALELLLDDFILLLTGQVQGIYGIFQPAPQLIAVQGFVPKTEYCQAFTVRQSQCLFDYSLQRGSSCQQCQVHRVNVTEIVCK